MACPCTTRFLQNLPQTAVTGISAGRNPRSGQRLTITDKYVCKVCFNLMKTLNPTGTLYVTIRKVSDDSIIATSPDTLDVSTLTGAYVWYCFTFPDTYVNEEVRVQAEYYGGDFNNYVRMGCSGSLIVGVLTVWNVAYTDYADYDADIELWESTATAPTVTTNPATNCAANGLSIQLNGQITATGGDNATIRGFRWGTTMGGPYPSNWSEAGSFGIGVFSHTPTIVCDTIYYYQAYATNCRGTTYGAEVSFSCNCPPEPEPTPTPEVIQHITNAITEWVYDYNFKYKAPEMIRADLISRIEETKRVKSGLVIQKFKKLLKIIGKVGNRFEETIPINCKEVMIPISFKETIDISAPLGIVFEEVKPTSITWTFTLISYTRIIGETISKEKEFLDELEWL